MTEGNITRRQHYVPDFYLQGWTDTAGKMAVHDLEKSNTFKTTPAGALVQSYFYEEDPDKPDNRIENILAEMEGRASNVIKKIRAITDGVEPESAAATLGRSLEDAELDILAEFAAYQYLRVPGAIEQKKYELGASEMTEAEKEHHLNPGRFVEGGYTYIVDKFKSLKFLFFISKGEEFITSDWPCFDADEDNEGTQLGEQIGEKPDVVAYMPLTPKVGCVMYPVGINEASEKSKRYVVNVQPDFFIKNQNTLVIQKAERFVVARNESPFIYSIAKKRKKNR